MPLIGISERQAQAHLEEVIAEMPYSENSWLGLAEKRRKLIAPHLDTFTLSTLDRVECLRIGMVERRALLTRVPVVGLGTRDMAEKVQGIFGCGYEEVLTEGQTSKYRDGYWPIWGLTRDNRWILAKVFYHYSPPDGQYRAQQYEKSVEIIEMGLAELCREADREPRVIWEALGSAVNSWRKRREELLKDADDLDRLMAVETLVVKAALREH